VVHGQTRLLVATRNRGKLRELSRLLSGCPFPLVSLDDVGIVGEVAETGATLEENAALKATTYARLSGLPTLADDSALEVDALGGQPGVRSARFAGDYATDPQNIALLLQKLASAASSPSPGRGSPSSCSPASALAASSGRREV
jgi:XTP/dITP diphosphohydrolase